MISSIDLFFKRDCAGGRGPAVEAPRLALTLALSSAVAKAVVVKGSVVGRVGVLIGGLPVDSYLLGKMELGGAVPGILFNKLGKRDGAEEVAVGAVVEFVV